MRGKRKSRKRAKRDGIEATVHEDPVANVFFLLIVIVIVTGLVVELSACFSGSDRSLEVDGSNVGKISGSPRHPDDGHQLNGGGIENNDHNTSGDDLGIERREIRQDGKHCGLGNDDMRPQEMAP